MVLLPELKDRSRKLRKNMTDAERRIWEMLHNRQMEGYRFLRQHPIGHYITDFYCRELRLVIEADGGQHAQEEGEEYDAKRTAFLHERGLTVLRFWNNEILQYPGGVYARILEYIDACTTHPPLPSKEGRKMPILHP